MSYSDPCQWFRMTLIWPVIVGCVAFFAVRFVAATVDGQLTRWQAVLAGVCAVMAAVVSMTISRNWTDSDVYWLAFTLGLTFAALVLLGNVIMQIIQAERNDG